MAAYAQWYGPNQGGTALDWDAFSASSCLLLAAGTALSGQEKPGAWHPHAAVGQPRQHVSLSQKVRHGSGGKIPFPCIWALQICPITCQKLAVGDCANRCTKRQNYALQAGFFEKNPALQQP